MKRHSAQRPSVPGNKNDLCAKKFFETGKGDGVYDAKAGYCGAATVESAGCVHFLLSPHSSFSGKKSTNCTCSDIFPLSGLDMAHLHERLFLLWLFLQVVVAYPDHNQTSCIEKAFVW